LLFARLSQQNHDYRSRARHPDGGRDQARLSSVYRWRSPWENGFIESFNARLRDELLDGEIFYTLAEAKIVVESWWRHFNTVRPHGSLGYKPPAPEVFIPSMAARAAAQPGPAAPSALAPRPTVHQQSTRTSRRGRITQSLAGWTT
jgi:hypothetical protein